MSNVPNLRTDGPLTLEDLDAIEGHARHVIEHPRTGDRPRRWDSERILRLCAALRGYLVAPTPFAFDLTPERLAAIEEVERTGPIWRREDHPIPEVGESVPRGQNPGHDPA